MGSAPKSATPRVAKDPAAVTMRIDAPGRAIRSATEIERIPRTICDEKLALTAYLGQGERLFDTNIRAVDVDLDRVVVDFSQWKPANTAILASESVLFHCDRKRRHVQFPAPSLAQVVIGRVAALQFAFPSFVLDLQQRTDRRIRIKSPASMWCVINRRGHEPIVASLADISRGGIGAFVHEMSGVLTPGAVFRDCQITGALLKRPVNVNVEVRYWKTARSPDGKLSKRVGCRFVAPSKELQKLVEAFELEFDEHGRTR